MKDRRDEKNNKAKIKIEVKIQKNEMHIQRKENNKLQEWKKKRIHERNKKHTTIVKGKEK